VSGLEQDLKVSLFHRQVRGLVLTGLGEHLLRRAVENGIGTGVLPDYLNEPESGFVQLMTHVVMSTVDCDLVYPEAMNNVARLQAAQPAYSCQPHLQLIPASSSLI